MTRSISIFLLLVGLLWGFIVASYLSIMLGGISNLGYLGKMLLYFSWQYVGPFLLMVGAILVLRRTHQKTGRILALAGCFILTVMAGSVALQTLHDIPNPALMKPPYGEYAVAVILILLADAGAVQLYRVASQSATK